MSVIAAALKHMLASGMPHDAIVAAVAEMEAAAAPKETPRSAGAIRQQRYRDRNKASQNVTSDVTSVTVTDEVSPKKETSPTPPKEKTTPSTTEPSGSSKTRAARLPADWVLPFEWREDGIKAGLPDDRLNSEAEKMRDWSLSSPSGAKLNWRAAWRNWAKGAAEKLPRGRGGTPQQPKPKGADHFDNFAEELRHGRAGNSRGNQGDWDDAAGVPILSIEHYRRNA